MIKKGLLFVGLLLAITNLNAQINQFPLKGNKEIEPVKFLSKNSNSFQLKVSFDKLNWKERKVKTGETYTELWFEKSNSSGEVGTPQLPAYKKLILLPYGASASIKVKNYTQKEYSSKEIGLTNPIIPVQPSVRKDQDSTTIPFQVKKDVYSKQSYIQNSIAEIEVLGNLRSYTIARVTVNPVDYNPAMGNIKVYNDIDIEINVTNSTKGTQDLKSIYSPYFDFLTKSMLNTTESVYDQHPDLTKYPTKMLIVSNRMFENSLAPFIQWKTQKGFKVITAYTDVIGNSTAQIKSHIQQVYNSATAEDPAPTFLVFVGDVEQVPSSQIGSQTEKHTDLYYASIDGDIFPEMYYGRLSATSTQQLDNIISKILYYEKYQFANPEYLNEVTLIAGEDGTWNPNVGQPTIKYGTANYFNSLKGFTTVNEYGVSSDPNNPNAQSGYTGCYDPNKISVGFINYTAHCNETSWGGPELSISAINIFSNINEYPLVIANCCRSGDFGTGESIGEAWIRAQNKGAVSYIGSADYSYWKEDMYWAVGAFPMVGNNSGYVPAFEETTIGAYDASNISKYITNGGICFAGNLAVTEADLKDYPRDVTPTYYWETYNILGDPSIMPYFTSASENEITHEKTIPVGSTLLKVSATEGTYVSITKNSEIIGTSYFNQTQELDIPIQTIQEPGKLLLTATKAQTIPRIDTVEAVVVSGPYITINSVSINDSQANNNGLVDFGETIKANVTLKNVGLVASTNTRMIITGQSNFATLTSPDSVQVGTIQAGTESNSVTINDAFTFNIVSNLPDQSIAKFNVTIKSNESTWTSSINLKINSPKISAKSIVIDDSVIGNNNDVANIGESFHGIITLKNEGHSTISDLVAIITLPDSVTDYVILNYEPQINRTINAGESLQIITRLSINPALNETKVIPIITNISSNSCSSINKEFVSEFEVAPDNVIKMKNQTVSTCFAIFTDSGGDGEYSNDENYITTINSTSEFGKLKVKFSEFSAESGYDYLYVYDGESTNSTQINGSPFNGTNIPADIISSGKSLTFKFTSDGGVVSSGWKATITCVEPTSIPLCVTNPKPASGSTDINTSQLEWNGDSEAQFYDVYLGYTENNLVLLGRTYTTSINVDLEKNKDYYWRVIPGNYIGICDKSCEVWNFKTSSSIGNINITNGTFTTDSIWFYDSGGALNTYSDDENYTITFKPKTLGTKLKVTFEQFNVETETDCGYDNLNIYDGPSTTSTLVGKYCGTSLPTSFTSTSDNGELTFKFKSDNGVTASGWKAKISSVGSVTLYTLTLTVKDNGSPVNNALVNVNGTIKITGSNGEAQFSVPAGSFNYTVNANGYLAVSNTGTNSGSNQSLSVDLKKPFNSIITVLDNSSNQPIELAKVNVNGASYYTNSSGVTNVLSGDGSQNITIEKTGYSTTSTTFNVTNENGSFEFKLAPVNYTVSVLVKDINGNVLPSATVEVNGNSSNTDSNGLVALELPFGIYKLNVSKDDYLSSSQWINIVAESQISVILDLLVVNLTNVDFIISGKGPLGVTSLIDATVSIYSNSQLYNQQKTNTSGKAVFQLPEGSYKYNVVHEGYETISNIEFVVTNSNIEIKDTLDQQTYVVTFDVKSNGSAVVGANVTLSGYNSQVTNNQGLAVFNTVGFAKGLSFEVQKDGFQTYTGSAEINTNKTIEVALISTGIEDPSFRNLKIYPNPVSDNLFIKSDNQIETVQIISITGSIVIEQLGEGLKIINVPVNYLPKGSYITRVKFSDGKIVHSKLIKI